jgi:hypothetical protein
MVTASALTAAGLALVGAFGGVLDSRPAPPTSGRERGSVRAALETEPASCAVTYRLRTDDGHRFTGALLIRNTGPNPVTGATLGFTMSGDQMVTGEGTGWSQDGSTVRVQAGSLAPGAVRELRFRGTYRAANPLPARFSLGQTACEPTVEGAAATGQVTAGQPAATPAGPPDAASADSGGHGKKPKNK